MPSGRISRNSSENIFRSYTGTASEIPIFTFLLPSLIAHASQPDGNMTSFTLHFSCLTLYGNMLVCERGTPQGITEENCTGF